MNKKIVIAAGAALLGVLLVRSQADAAAAESDDGSTALDYVDPIGAIDRFMDQSNLDTDMRDTNTRAFLSMIAAAEGTDLRSDPYRVCFGYRHTIQSFTDHPAVTREWTGESIAHLGSQYAGMVSTAAGRYQIIRATWLSARRALGLADFSPMNQDAAACWLIRNRGAMGDVQAGRIEAAIGKCKAEWASLPGAGYGQPERKLSTLLAKYETAGGVLA